MSHHHSILDNPEGVGTTIGTAIGFAIGFIKHSLVVLLLDIELHVRIMQLIQDIIFSIPTALVGAIVGFYGTKFIKWFHRIAFENKPGLPEFKNPPPPPIRKSEECYSPNIDESGTPPKH